MDKFTEEFLKAAKGAKSAKELLALAGEMGVEMSEADADALFNKMTASGELSDDELENVSGGGFLEWLGIKKTPSLKMDKVVMAEDTCEKFVCHGCGAVGRQPSSPGSLQPFDCASGEHYAICAWCKNFEFGPDGKKYCQK